MVVQDHWQPILSATTTTTANASKVTIAKEFSAVLPSVSVAISSLARDWYHRSWLLETEPYYVMLYRFSWWGCSPDYLKCYSLVVLRATFISRLSNY